jgi:hypothetical protein
MELKFLLLSCIKLAIIPILLIAVSITSMGLAQQNKPIYLHIQNNTGTSFKITQNEAVAGGRPVSSPLSGTILSDIKPHEFKTFNLAPSTEVLGILTGIFRLHITGQSIIEIELIIEINPTTTDARIKMYQTKGSPEGITPLLVKSQINQIPAAPDNTFHVFITLKGDITNGFKGSTINLEVKNIQQERLKEHLQKHPQSLEQIQQIPRK